MAEEFEIGDCVEYEDDRGNKAQNIVHCLAKNEQGKIVSYHIWQDDDTTIRRTADQISRVRDKELIGKMLWNWLCAIVVPQPTQLSDKGYEILKEICDELIERQIRASG